jgi:hypothetical protein
LCFYWLLKRRLEPARNNDHGKDIEGSRGFSADKTAWLWWMMFSCDDFS